jgi:predicted heme/steroid binding protein
MSFPLKDAAGQDLTDELKDAPHNEEVFAKWKVIGKLAPD